MKISCIIPAYNEGKRIKNVLEIATKHNLIDEVIVIDDGSKDNTADVVNEFKDVVFIQHNKNTGKTIAVYEGIKKSKNEIVLFLDADLIYLNEKNITDLATPVLEGKVDMTLSLRKNSPRLWHLIGIDYISGERALLKNIIEPYLSELPKLKGFGLEVFLNNIIIKNNNKIKVIGFPNVDGPYKIEKMGFWKGLMGEFVMIFEIMKTVSVFGPIYQIIKLKKLEVK